MAINLKELKPQQISKNLRGKYIMLYGLPGVGKTSLAAQFEGVLIAGFEMGTNALNNVYVQPIKTWRDWKQVVSQLSKDAELKEQFHAVAIDTADEAWNLCVRYICDQNNINELGELAYGKGYDLAKKEFAGTFRDLAYNGYGLIFTSHSTEKTYKNENNEEYSMIVPALQNRPFDVINKMVDIIAYIREISVSIGEDKTERQRFMFLRDPVGDRFLAKSRYKYIQPRIPLDYQALVDAIYSAIDEEVNHTGGTATEEENPYTGVLNFDELMEEAKRLWGQLISKDLLPPAKEILAKEFGRDIKFSEILPEQVESLNKVLNEIRALL